MNTKIFLTTFGLIPLFETQNAQAEPTKNHTPDQLKNLLESVKNNIEKLPQILHGPAYKKMSLEQQEAFLLHIESLMTKGRIHRSKSTQQALSEGFTHLIEKKREQVATQSANKPISADTSNNGSAPTIPASPTTSAKISTPAPLNTNASATPDKDTSTTPISHVDTTTAATPSTSRSDTGAKALPFAGLTSEQTKELVLTKPDAGAKTSPHKKALLRQTAIDESTAPLPSIKVEPSTEKKLGTTLVSSIFSTDTPSQVSRLHRSKSLGDDPSQSILSDRNFEWDNEDVSYHLYSPKDQKTDSKKDPVQPTHGGDLNALLDSVQESAFPNESKSWASTNTFIFTNPHLEWDGESIFLPKPPSSAASATQKADLNTIQNDEKTIAAILHPLSEPASSLDLTASKESISDNSPKNVSKQFIEDKKDTATFVGTKISTDTKSPKENPAYGDYYNAKIEAVKTAPSLKNNPADALLFLDLVSAQLNLREGSLQPKDLNILQEAAHNKVDLAKIFDVKNEKDHLHVIELLKNWNGEHPEHLTKEINEKIKPATIKSTETSSHTPTGTTELHTLLEKTKKGLETTLLESEKETLSALHTAAQKETINEVHAHYEQVHKTAKDLGDAIGATRKQLEHINDPEFKAFQALSSLEKAHTGFLEAHALPHDQAIGKKDEHLAVMKEAVKNLKDHMDPTSHNTLNEHVMALNEDHMKHKEVFAHAIETHGGTLTHDPKTGTYTHTAAPHSPHTIPSTTVHQPSHTPVHIQH